VRDPTALFTQGVWLQVKPDGRQWQSYKQLSGGQQAVAALALSLAIDSVNPSPSPVLLLDEVDAALDVGAVKRLAEILKQHAHHGRQVFAITHRLEVSTLLGTKGNFLSLYILIYTSISSMIRLEMERHRSSAPMYFGASRSTAFSRLIRNPNPRTTPWIASTTTNPHP